MLTRLKDAIASGTESHFMDGTLYSEPAFLPFELKHIFRQTWLYVGDAQDLMQSENVRAIEIAGTSILIVQGSDRVLRAFYNVCPHRASLLCSQEGSHQLKHLVCPYHGWVYDLDGKLIGVPREERFASDFCSEDFPLTPVRLEQWAGFVFVCFNSDAPPLLEFLGQISTSMNCHRTGATRLLVSKQYSINCNWKVYHDNTLCDYHVAIAHRKTINLVQGPIRAYEYSFDQYVNLLYTPTTPQWQADNKVLEDLPDRNRRGFFTYGIFPNLHLLALPNGVLAWIRLDPVTVNTCNIHLDIFGIPGLCSSTDVLLNEFEAFMFEDVQISEGVQKGYESGVYRSGLINNLEARIAHHQRLLRQFLLAGLETEQAFF